ncbi:hypothetical protein DMUE_3146 [Dictyocoela muelleri]|nr:hypothetical protein DMUE_3146 [Dictyocoela muelleri]
MAKYCSMMSRHLEKVEDLKLYVENTRLFTTNKLFSRNVWSRNTDLETRTNNALEFFYANINKAVNKSNPAYYDGVKILKKVMIVCEVESCRILSGWNSNPKK